MSIRYDHNRETLAELVRKATIDATYVIPDLQRPYVWMPSQVTRLIDSLFRGWPFGSLLLWEVKPGSLGVNEGIPNRGFWHVVDRTESDVAQVASRLGHPATYKMVLDGQQRLQSLVLALGGDQWGFQLHDSDWALDLQDRRVRASEHWSKGVLCIDLELFAAELARQEHKVRKLETARTLAWAVTDPLHGRSAGPRPANYVQPIPSSTDHPGRFIRLSRLWALVQQGLSEDEYAELLQPILQEHAVAPATLERLLKPLAQFMRVVEGVKVNGVVHALQIESLIVTPQWSKDDYSDAIVNIFTRLNTAGRVLSAEQITLAWLKTGWESGRTGNKMADACLHDLQATMEELDIAVETDEIVRLISFLWAVDHRGGTLLDSRDLLKGDVVRPMARAVSESWQALMASLSIGVKFLAHREVGGHLSSFNSVIVLLTWLRLAHDRRVALAGSVPQRHELEMKLDACARGFVDRWIFASQWSGAWGDGAATNFQAFASDLHVMRQELGLSSSEDFIERVEQGAERLLGRVVDKALAHVETISVRDRSRVSAYQSLLWVWHRLDQSRWDASAISMRLLGSRAKLRLDVDHTVADALWQEMVDAALLRKTAEFEGSEIERALLAPGDFQTMREAREFINSLGNCALLEKSFNISKSKKAMWHFLAQVHQFKNEGYDRDAWEASLGLSRTLTEPQDSELSAIVAEIQARDRAIRGQLADFLTGSRSRVDIGN